MTEQSEEKSDWPEIKNVEFSVISTVNDIKNLGEGLDIPAATFGRYGIDGFTIQMVDVDDEERSWVLRDGEMYTTDEFIAQFEYLVDREREMDAPLSPEEIEAIKATDAPAERE